MGIYNIHEIVLAAELRHETSGTATFDDIAESVILLKEPHREAQIIAYN